MNATVKVGQKLYEPNRYGGDYREYEVERIGRKWVALKGGMRCTIETLLLDTGGYAPRQLYASKDEHRAASRLAAAWADLRRDVGYMKRPEGITVEKINEIRRALGLKVLSDKLK